MSQSHHNTRRTSVIINLLKISNGYMVENEKPLTTISIPKEFASQKKKNSIQQPRNQQYSTPPYVQSQVFTQTSQLPDKNETLPEQIVKKRQPQKYALIIPSSSSWFHLDRIHQIEKDALPEYFKGTISKTPEIYKRQRNYIINLYRSNPQQYLSITACRRVLAGDACGIMRIHQFLQHWGIINFSVEPENNIGFKHPVITQSLKDELEDNLQDTTQQEQFLIHTLKILSKNYRPICSYCGIICGLIWFQQKHVSNEINEIILCVQCYSDANYPQILAPEDFQKTDIESKFDKIDIFSKIQKGERIGTSFNQDESITLLQLLQEQPELKWEQITGILNKQHNNNRSNEEVILHFLQLPFKNADLIKFIPEIESNITIEDMLKQIAYKEPQIYSDHSNALTFHISLFRRLIRKYMKKEEGDQKQIKEVKEVKEDKIENEEEQQKEFKKYTIESQVGEQEYEVKELQNKKLEESREQIEQLEKMCHDEVRELKQETMERAEKLKSIEEEKMRNISNLLISIQMEKLELKLSYLEEYEKLILYERNQLELCQKMSIGERLQIVQQRLQMRLDEYQQE